MSKVKGKLVTRRESRALAEQIKKIYTANTRISHDPSNGHLTILAIYRIEGNKIVLESLNVNNYGKQPQGVEVYEGNKYRAMLQVPVKQVFKNEGAAVQSFNQLRTEVGRTHQMHPGLAAKYNRQLKAISQIDEFVYRSLKDTESYIQQEVNKLSTDERKLMDVSNKRILDDRAHYFSLNN